VPHRTSQPPGNALIAVTFIGMFIMLIASTVVNNLMLSEVEAVEESLAKTRIYWASRGHLDYALSRIKSEGTCDEASGGCTADDGVDFPSGQQPDDNTRVEVAENGSAVDGYLRVTITLVKTGTIGSLQGLKTRVRPVQIDVCLGSPKGTSISSCNSTGPNPSTQVSNLTSAETSGDSFVFRMRRPPSP
jgi:hypothetical protein